jgi:peptidoglycan-associated lipoprotein
MLRKYSVVLPLAVVLLFALFACSKKQTADTTAAADPEPTATEEPPPVEDFSEPAVEPEVVEEPMPVLTDVFFDFDKATLTSGSRRELEKNARQLKTAGSVTIIIEGHCDERGTNAYNLALGGRRAKAARDYLQSLGVATSRMRTVSYGEERPFASGHEEDAWAKNRRAHFVIASK